MRISLFALLVFLNLTYLLGQEDVRTSGDNSPALIARNFSATYGVRADAVEAILRIYEAEGYDIERRKNATEQILREYAQSPEKQQKADELSTETRRKMGIADAPKVANALEWDLFARSRYLSTTGNSPAVLTKGDVNIWYGIAPKALHALAAQLEKNKTDLTNNFETQLAEQVKKYEELKTELETYGSQEEIYRQAEALLEEGKLEDAEQLIESDFEAFMERQAYKGHIYGKIKELLLKYNEAAKGYKNAVNNDEGNSSYHLYYADNEYTLAHHDEAIKHYEIALNIDILSGGNEERIATLLSNLGRAWEAKGDYDKAIDYYEKALQIDLNAFGGQHLNVAIRYKSLGTAWHSKGEYDKTIAYYEKALQIFLNTLGEEHSNVAGIYSDLGAAWGSKREYDKAIAYYEKALQMDLNNFGDQNPNVVGVYNNLGAAWYSKGDYDKAIGYFEKSQIILDRFFEPTHPDQKNIAQNSSIASSSRGMELFSKEKYQEALGYFQKALENAQKAQDIALALSSLKNIGAAQQHLQQYEKGLEELDMGLQLAAQLHQEVDRAVKEQLTSEERNDPEIQAEIAAIKNMDTVRRMQYHKVGCLKGLKRDKEADALAKQLWQEGIEANDIPLLEDLREYGYDFER